ncbi:MAG: DUF3604 domain-containing protein [Burkholderiales bacterium]
MPHSHYVPHLMGSATIAPTGEFEAGSFAEFTLTYTAGYFGIDDTGSLKIVHRFASDMGKPQFNDPLGWNYTTVEASNGAVLQIEYDGKRNIRPWDKTLFIRVVRGFLKEGDQIIVRFGDRRSGSRGMRVQTFCEPTFEFKVLVDAFAAYEYVEIKNSPTISIVAGPPVHYKAVLPTIWKTGEPFRFRFKAEDKWGNPSDKLSANFQLKSNLPVQGLPDTIQFERGAFAATVDHLVVLAPGDLSIDVLLGGVLVTTSNPCRIAAEVPMRHYWADLHGQSEETIGTNSATDLIEFARDRAFLDVMCHQGNDFQITTEFWNELNTLTARYNKDGEFIIFPGYEWSGNTSLGGDRNVMYLKEGRTIYRSSHALLSDLSDVQNDANDAPSLFEFLKKEDSIVFAHVGGRYADIALSHNAQIERSVEIHSDWGTFEWLLEDAFMQGYRVGILANSDGHKGRQGASHPGASLFGAYGGLSCLVARELTRASIAECLRSRHHYATTGCRAFLDLRVRFDKPASILSDDPNLGGPITRESRLEAEMGAVVDYDGDNAWLDFEILTDGPIECIEVRNLMEVVERIVPYSQEDIGNRIRIMWEGSEYRGRGRQTVWDGSATLTGNAFLNPTPINFWNLDKTLNHSSDSKLEWQSLTTGGFSGVDVTLEKKHDGQLLISTPLVTENIQVKEIGNMPIEFSAGGINRRVRIYRLPDVNVHKRMKAKVRVPLHAGKDNAIYLRATTETGFYVFSSPVYVVRTGN